MAFERLTGVGEFIQGGGQKVIYQVWFRFCVAWCSQMRIFRGGDKNKLKAKLFHGVRLVVLWVVWRWRNLIVHEPSDSRHAIIDRDDFPQIQYLSQL
ncbi:hypothetical protein CTI12_AA152800 [Artemisia annua]|uniref:Uncharacterized protein n=1 Tax=Artemisia annua TaxID=35608 RepID=A0A2U1N4R6_ARTAN|nr:hypothetical protein CTI12_AA152800 [Artemisia annua]